MELAGQIFFKKIRPHKVGQGVEVGERQGQNSNIN